VGGLAHYLEDEGISTTQISIIREHTVKIKPPRALWVTFELGRPLGLPNDPAFQTRVLLSALRLLEASSGPVLEDFPEEAPASDTDAGLVACPVSFAPPGEDVTAKDDLLSAFKQEVDQMRNWYDLAVERRGRTTAGTTGMKPEQVAGFISAFVHGGPPANPVPDTSLGMALKMATEDLKAYYFEAVTARAGQPTDSASLADWFWSQTAAARVINATREVCSDNADDELQLVGKRLLVPLDQRHRFEN
jgi:hypothetical protein